MARTPLAAFFNIPSMEAMSDAGAAHKHPALRGNPSLAQGGVAPRSQSPARLPRRALPGSQIWASQLYRLFRDAPLDVIEIHLEGQ